MYRQCITSTSNGFQPSCFSGAPVTQAVAKIDKVGTLKLQNGEELQYNLKGVVSFYQLNPRETRIYAFFTGVKDFFKDSEYFLLHVHMHGEINPSCSATGSHYNPCGKEHSDDPTVSSRHIGDVAKVKLVESSDTVTIDVIDTQVKLSGPLSTLGRSVTVHAGKSEARIGCAIIGVTDWGEGDRHPDTTYNPDNPTEFWQK